MENAFGGCGVPSFVEVCPHSEVSFFEGENHQVRREISPPVQGIMTVSFQLLQLEPMIFSKNNKQFLHILYMYITHIQALTKFAYLGNKTSQSPIIFFIFAVACLFAGERS